MNHLHSKPQASITVEGTEFVIDSARAKEVSYDPYLKAGTWRWHWDRVIDSWFTHKMVIFHGYVHKRLPEAMGVSIVMGMYPNSWMVSEKGTNPIVRNGW